MRQTPLVLQYAFEPDRYVRELFIVPTRQVAEHGGFHPTSRRHRQDLTIMAWWPGCSEDALRGIELERVTIDSGVHRWLREYGTQRQRDEMHYLVRRLPTRLRRGKMVWVNL